MDSSERVLKILMKFRWTNEDVERTGSSTELWNVEAGVHGSLKSVSDESKTKGRVIILKSAERDKTRAF